MSTTPQPLSTELLQTLISQLRLPQPDSHKGQNGKVLIIGGSELFHAASQWALTVVSRMVDMVFYSSVPSNNQLIHEAKQHFANGIVVNRDQVEEYLQEADVILIGPGMERSPETEKLTNTLLAKYPTKKWVVDAGALQMLNPQLLTETMILTPHHKEFEWLMEKVEQPTLPSTLLLKGPLDTVYPSSTDPRPPLTVQGGNEGMTKGGTGDVLAGLVAGLYAFTDDPFVAAVVASQINKQAGDELYEQVGPFFNATDLANQIPKTLHSALSFSFHHSSS